MNLETFKARARRKLELPKRNADATAASEPDTGTTVNNPVDTPADTSEPKPDNTSDRAKQYQANTMSTPTESLASTPSTITGSVPNESAGVDRFAAALEFATKSSAAEVDTGDAPSDPQGANFAAHEPMAAPSRQSTTDGRVTSQPSSDAQLAHLRSLLLGNEQESQRDQVDTVYRRTQSSISILRRDMDARMTDLSDYVEQLEQSLLNSLDNQQTGLSEDTAEVLSRHEQRLDAIDTRLDSLFDTARADMETQRNKDRADLEAKLSEVSRHHDAMLNDVSDRLDRGLAQMESNISSQLKTQSSTSVIAPEETIRVVRDQLDSLIDERVRNLNSDQDASLKQLRETVLMHTRSIKEELQAQTEQQSTQLASHRSELETQFNLAIMSLNDNKVSHKQLSKLLTRLADRVKEL